jgi:hypothetical protein
VPGTDESDRRNGCFLHDHSPAHHKGRLTRQVEEVNTKGQIEKRFTVKVFATGVAAAEPEAQRDGRGLWSMPRPVPPREFRHPPKSYSFKTLSRRRSGTSHMIATST